MPPAFRFRNAKAQATDFRESPQETNCLCDSAITPNWCATKNAPGCRPEPEVRAVLKLCFSLAIAGRPSRARQVLLLRDRLVRCHFPVADVNDPVRVLRDIIFVR